MKGRERNMVNKGGYGICSKTMMMLYPLMEAVRSGTERVGGEGYGVYQGYKRESGRGAYLLRHIQQ
ncbi:hypothetical protein [Butyrivibrio proteoclasticus]|uniref:hypothetical protein n=1 Tax=Butyrivibrio proteoclasticus TaxID=43305 RepID=UPI002E8E366C|nr:hypothetical protein [Butyrivibrio proteoclasticus]